MLKIPFEKQRLPIDVIDQISHDLAHGRAASGTDLIRALEQGCRKLSDRLRKIVRQFSVPAVKTRGRPANSKGRIDFAMEELDGAYLGLLEKFRKAARASDARARNKRAAPPSELAYRQLLDEMRGDFGNIDWLTLRNLHSKWKRGHLHPAENDVDSSDFDAAIEQYFPAPKRS